MPTVKKGAKKSTAAKKKVVKKGESPKATVKKKKKGTSTRPPKKTAKKKSSKGKATSRVTKSKVRTTKMPKRGRKVVYPKPSVEVLFGKSPLTATRAKELMGWVEETEKVKFGSDFLIRDENGNKIRCTNDVINRRIYPVVYETLKQEILRGRWMLNLENRIIGRTAQVLNGQHTFIALILAEQCWEKNPDDYPYWGKKPPTIETTIAYGCSEKDEVVNTIDTSRPRSLADVIYRSPYFADLQGSARQQVARMCDYATRLLWMRTGASHDAIAPRRTHSEALDFIARHPKVLECVSHIREEDGDKGISRFISPGYASGFLYLMGSGSTDPTEYRQAENPSEKLLSWDNWDTACEFFVELGQGSAKVKALRKELGNLLESEDGVSQKDRWALLTKGWLAFAEGKTLTAKNIALEFDVVDDVRVLKNVPPVGGIDIGEDDVDEEEVNGGDPNTSEVSKRSSSVKTSSIVKGTQKKKGEWGVGDTAWVFDPNSSEEPYFGEIIVDPYLTPNGNACEVRTQNGEEWEAMVAHLQVECPKAKGD